MRTNLWFKITHHQPPSDWHVPTGRNNHGTNRNGYPKIADDPGVDPQLEEDKVSASKPKVGQDHDGPFRMHQVPWIAIR